MKLLKLVTILAAALAMAAVLRNAGTFLVVSQPPQKADVIIVLGGNEGVRLQRGIQLYRQGYAPYLLYTTSVTDPEREQALAEGIPADAFILDQRARNTYQNATDSKALMEQYGLRSAIVVSSDYHTRRASLMFARVFKGTGTIFTYVGVPDPDFHPERWWTSWPTVLQMAYQYAGIAVFYIGMGPYITSAWIWDTPLKYVFRGMRDYSISNESG